MPVSSKRNSMVLEKTTEPNQYFSLGDMFLFTPTTDPGVEIPLEVVSADGLFVHCSGCDIAEYCLKDAHVPCCSDLIRKDGRSVVFKRI